MALSAIAAEASVRFVSPVEGAQVIGLSAIEVTADATAVDRVEFRIDGVLVGVARKTPYRIAHDFGTSLASRTIAARVFSNGYRTVEEAQVHTSALTAGESITVDLVEVPMRVRSARSVTAQDLRVRENSVDQSVREIKAGRGPAHFAFVIDRSLSMGGGKLEAALAAVDDAMKLLRPGDTSSVILFNHMVSKPQPRRSLGKIVPSGGTALRDALASIPAAQRTYAIVITDGGDRNSALTEEQALRKISGTKTMITAIVLGKTGSFLERATRNTGGSLVRTTNIRSAMRSTMLDINSRYTLVYQSHGTKNGWRTISVAPRRAGIEVLAARKGYFAE
jgi:hypothetical protein